MVSACVPRRRPRAGEKEGEGNGGLMAHAAVTPRATLTATRLSKLGCTFADAALEESSCERASGGGGGLGRFGCQIHIRRHRTTACSVTHARSRRVKNLNKVNQKWQYNVKTALRSRCGGFKAAASSGGPKGTPPSQRSAAGRTRPPPSSRGGCRAGWRRGRPWTTMLG